MHLVQLLIPVDRGADSAGRERIDRVRRELTDRFGGATAFARAAARGDWEDGGGEVQRDDVVLVEAMVETVDHAWWSAYREDHAARFGEECVVVRALAIDCL